jgi:hypothetical protein
MSMERHSPQYLFSVYQDLVTESRRWAQYIASKYGFEPILIYKNPMLKLIRP